MSYLPTSLRERRPHSILPENSQVKEAQDEKWQRALAKEEQVPFVYTKSEIPYKSNGKLPERQKLCEIPMTFSFLTKSFSHSKRMKIFGSFFIKMQILAL